MSMKRIFLFCITCVLTIFCFVPMVFTSVSADTNVSDWQVIKGETPQTYLENDKKVGLRFYGENSSEIFSYVFNKQISRNNIMLDFTLDTQNTSFENEVSLSFIFLDNSDTQVCSFHIGVKEESYSVRFVVDDKEYNFNEMLFKEKGHIQLRIARDNVTNYDSGEIVNAWNLVVGIQQKATSIKNDKYCQRINEFDDNSFSEIAKKLDEISDEIACTMAMKASSEQNNALGVLLTQVYTECFYDYDTLPVSNVVLGNVKYTEVVFSFIPPEIEYDYQGFLIERYRNGILEETFIYTSKYTNKLTDRDLKQDAEYVYSITALQTVSSTNRVACSRIAFKYEDFHVETLKGNPMTFIICICLLIIVCVAIIMVYVYYYDIKRKILKK